MSGNEPKTERYGKAIFDFQPELSDGSKGECESVEDMFDAALESAKRVLENCVADGYDFMPVAFVYAPLGKPKVNVCLVGEGFPGDGGKRKFGQAMSAFCARHNAAAVVICVDAWATQPPPELETREEVERWYAKLGGASKSARRTEVLSVNCIYPDGTAVGVMSEYKRVRGDGEKVRVEWGEVHDMRGSDTKVEQNLIPAWQKGVLA